MISKRKDQHLKYAKKLRTKNNDFDLIKLEHNSLPNLKFSDINLESNFLGFKVPYPFYINAMTGGSLKSYYINEKLAKLANHFNIPIVLGSQSAGLKNEKLVDTYQIVRKINPQGIVVANVSANASLEDAKRAIEMVNANALSIHINVIQELVMNEGDRDFSKWEKNIQTIVSKVNVPVIVKEVGFGMSKKTIEKLKSLGVKYLDVSGSGGTNFAKIERLRNKDSDLTFENISISTVQSLKNASNIDVCVHASGGIRNALDIYKAIKLGAKNVGLSKFFLELTKMKFEDAVIEIEKLISNLKKCYIIFS